MTSVAIASNGSALVAIVGASSKTIGASAQQGAAYVYACTNYRDTWLETARLTASDGGAAKEEYFGISVAIASNGSSGSLVAIVGANSKNVGGNTQQGAAYVFACDGFSGVWLETARVTASDGAALDLFVSRGSE